MGPGVRGPPRDRGLIRHLGLSGVCARQLAEARQIAPVVAVQNRYHLLDRGGGEVLAACERHDIAFVAYFPLGAGTLDPGWTGRGSHRAWA
jgi:pyridoxine 4-dehydrogenase